MLDFTVVESDERTPSPEPPPLSQVASEVSPVRIASDSSLVSEIDNDDLSQLGKVIERVNQSLQKSSKQSLTIVVYVENVTVNKSFTKSKTIKVKKGGKLSNDKIKISGDNLGSVAQGKGSNATSSTTITNVAGQSPELQVRLDELGKLVEELIAKLPTGKQTEVREDFEVLVNQSKSETPRQKWYELSAKGLIEAAESVVGMAAPVSKAVETVVALISGNST